MPVEKQVIHLVTQREQPYGSHRLSCERCGAWIIGNPHRPAGHVYTDDVAQFLEPPPGFVCCTDAVVE